MVTLCDARAAAYRECLAKGIVQAHKTERLPFFLDFYFNFLSDQGLAKPAVDAVFALAAAFEPIRENLHEQYDQVQYTIAHEVQISHPDLNQTACREIGFLFVSLMYGHWKMVATLGFDERYNQVTGDALDRIIQSYIHDYEDHHLADTYQDGDPG